jgi:hypothetical protein
VLAEIIIFRRVYFSSSHPTSSNIQKLSYDQLREAVKAAWEAIPIEELEELVETMHDRCEAVIKAEGRHTPY